MPSLTDSLGSMPETYIVGEDQFWKFLLAGYARHIPDPTTTSKQTYIHTYIHKRAVGQFLDKDQDQVSPHNQGREILHRSSVIPFAFGSKVGRNRDHQLRGTKWCYSTTDSQEMPFSHKKQVLRSKAKLTWRKGRKKRLEGKIEK